MDCERFRERLDDYAAGRLDADTARALAAHRESCPDCAAIAPRRARPPRLVAAGFVGAFAASIFTLIYTGLNVRGPDAADDAKAPRAAEAAPERGDEDTSEDEDEAEAEIHAAEPGAR